VSRNPFQVSDETFKVSDDRSLNLREFLAVHERPKEVALDLGR
jgi:hypothetical protein